MRVAILTMGSRGDVQPYLALAIGLQSAGHNVIVASHSIFESWIRSYGLDFALVRFNPKDIVSHPDVQKAKSNIVHFMLTVRRLLGAQYVDIFDDFWKACQQSDAIVASPTASNASECAQALGIPLAIGLLQPLIPTRRFSSYFLPPLPRLCSPLNKASHHFFDQILWQNARGKVGQWRSERLGRGPAAFFGPSRWMNNERVPHLFACSPKLIAKPADWEEWHHITGYWFLPQRRSYQPAPEIERFLSSGPPPVYVGFGSMNDDQPERLTEVVIDALERSNQRGILATGWGGLHQRDLPDGVLAIDEIPHEWLFPQVAAVVHHGGAGTTGAVLRAGVPSIAVPFGGDQVHWGRLLVRRDLSPQVLPVGKLKVDSLANAISKCVTDRGLQATAASFGESVRQENGIFRAVEILEEYFRG